MKKYVKYIYAGASLLIAAAAIQSCAVEEPFGVGEGVVRMKLLINSDVTRAAMNEQELADNCVVYISNSKGLVFKERGLSNLPDVLSLKRDHYYAEAWTGDSVPASFDSKFFRGYQEFDVNAGENNLTLTCKITNVVASVNPASIDPEQVKNIHVTVANSTGSLEFTSDNFNTAKGYFMMPFNEKGERENVLNFTIEGENLLGESFRMTKSVEGVEPAHEYVVSLKYEGEEEDPRGGGYITIQIDEKEVLIAETVEIFAAPVIEGVGFDIEKQIIGEPGMFSGDRIVKVVAFDEITAFTIECVDAGGLNLPAQAVDLKRCDDATIAQLNAAGITWDKTVENLDNNKDGHRRQLTYITFSESYLNSLPERSTEYRIVLGVTDGTATAQSPGKTTTKTLRIAVGKDAIVYEDPIIIDDEANESNQLAITTTSANIEVSLKDMTATNPGIRYREQGTETWYTALMPLTKSGVTATISLTGLKPGTRYEYQAIADGFISKDTKYFTTESPFIIPNASMEEWSDFSENNKILLPDAGGERTFWDTGNHGSATLSVTLTQASTDMFHSGSKSARLRSQFVAVGALGKFAAGNLFAGTYLETQGTDGRIEFGREYNGSHPKALKVFVNYRPQPADKNGSKNGKLAIGDLDKGQIYVALTTEKVEVRTKKSNQKLWDTNDPCVLAYGEKIFSENYGPDGGLQELEISLDYKPAAKSQKPLYLVIVCTASYYGDFFDGGEGSTMYVDDFELVY